MQSSFRTAVTVLRGTRLALHIGYGLLLAIAYPWFDLKIRRRILQRWSTELLQIFNVRIDIARDDPLHTLHSGLIVTNHISWLDVFVLNAIVPMRFVAKSEVRRWPAIGWLCARAQTLFIERGNARSAARCNVQLASLMQRGECLAIFPEGTTTDGTSVAHFHSSLLQPAIDAAATVQPVAIRYQDKNGAHSFAAAYIGEMSFGESMWSILSTPELHVRLVGTPALEANSMDRRDLTRMAHQLIGETLHAMHAPFTVSHSHAEMDKDELHFQSLYSVLLKSPTTSPEHQPAK